jgi:hypothetical protein
MNSSLSRPRVFVALVVTVIVFAVLRHISNQVEFR